MQQKKGKECGCCFATVGTRWRDLRKPQQTRRLEERERATLARGWFIRWLYNRGAPHSTYISTGEMFYVWQGTNISPIFVFFLSFILAVFHSSYTVDDGIRLMPTQTIWGQQSKRLAAMFCQHAIKQSDLCDWTHNEIGHNFLDEFKYISIISLPKTI